MFFSIAKETALTNNSPITQQALGYVEALAKQVEYNINQNLRSFVSRDLNRLRNFIVTFGLRSNSQALDYVVNCLETIAKEAIRNINSDLLLLSLVHPNLYTFSENVEFYNLKNSGRIQTIVISINSAFDNKIGYYEKQRLQSLVTYVREHKESFNVMYDSIG